MFSLRRYSMIWSNAGHLVRLDDEIDPHLEAAEIQRRVYARGGPAVLFANVKGCRFPMVSNLFGTIERARYLFRHTYENVRRAIELKIDPARGTAKSAALCGRAADGLADAAAADSGAARCCKTKRRSASCRSSSAGRTTAERSSRCRSATPKTSISRALRTPISACTASSFRAAVMFPIAKSACTIKFIAASASITRRPCGPGSRCESISSSAAIRR